ncbi:hypothetical protein ACFE04_013416 [Oxalis oulophora]
MASAQVLRKQEQHLQAGKRRLEEFRKKKAAERSKKTEPTDVVSLQEKQHVQTEQVRPTNSTAAVNSYENHAFVSITNNHNINNNNNNDTKAIIESTLTSENDQEITTPDKSPSFVPQFTSNYSYGSAPVDRHSLANQHYDTNYYYTQSISNGYHLKENNQPLKASPIQVLPGPVLQTKSSNTATLEENGYKSTLQDSYQPSIGLRSSGFQAEDKIVHGNAKLTQSSISDLVEKKLSNSASSLPYGDRAFEQTSSSLGLNFDSGSLSNQSSLYSGSNEATRRSRPSFLDSISVSKAEPERDNSPLVNNTGFLGSSAFSNSSTEAESKGIFSKFTNSNATSSLEQSRNSSVFSANGGDFLKSSASENTMERKNEFYSAKQNEDFAALEQYIEDLTQEKFSLQRALDGSQALSESLAAENSSLTDTYNQQRSIVNQLRSEMENLQEEITSQLAELDAVKHEYANLQLECSAADERANILASEVIGLEEKALRLRSNELKLERQMENSQAEISSFKKKISSIEKDRQDLQSTISALQEGNQDTSSDTTNQELHIDGSLLGSDASNIHLLPESGQLGVSSMIIPSDQMRIIRNINSLVSELTLEKQELTQALSSESSQSSKLKELNKELSRKLEAQTQRLELLTAQSMASENVSARQPDTLIVQDNTPYADEGDEDKKNFVIRYYFSKAMEGSFKSCGKGIRMDYEALSWRTVKKKNQQASVIWDCLSILV